jgi:nitroreductase
MTRKAQYPISDFILNRWSPRAMSGETITKDELMPLFEAAHWAPSSYNNQPWRFIYAMQNTPTWDKFFDLLVSQNQTWCTNASALVVIASKNSFDFNDKFSKTHSFDTGAAWQNLALQGYINGLVVHGMEGFDYAKAAEVINLPPNHTIEAMIAIGKPDLLAQLQEIKTQSKRKLLSEVAFEGAVE